MKDMTKIQYHSLWVLLTLLIIAFDQITKVSAVHYLYLHEQVYIFPGLNFTLAYNYGAAFSFLSQAGGWQIWFFLVLSIVISGVLMYLLIIGRVACINKIKFFSYVLILSGALGNFIDRVTYGYVIDFIDVYVKSFHWPIFNIADSAITCGALLFLYENIQANRELVKKKKV